MYDVNSKEVRTLLCAALVIALGSWCADRLSHAARRRRRDEREAVSRWEDEGGAPT
jgi:hypothetical protein